MPVGHYRFFRAKSINGFFSQNSTSTDAHNAVLKWSNYQDGRSYDTLEDDRDEVFAAKLSWSESDSLAGTDLDNCCQISGLDRLFAGKF